MWIVKFAMQCGHEKEAPFNEIHESMYCNKCQRKRKVKGIESREWYFKCGGCRYARFTGQSKQEAETLLGIHRVHNRHSDGSVWYRRHPAKSVAIRKAWGRKIRDVLIQDNKIYPDENLPLREWKRGVQEVMLPDKPNF